MSATPPPAGVVARTLARGADIAWFALSAAPVLVATLGCGGWLALALLDALVATLAHPSWRGAGQLLATLAGSVGVLVVFRAWCALLRRHDSTVGRARWQVATVAVLATAATVRAALTTQPVASRFHQYPDQPPTLHTNWFPVVLLGSLALGAALLMLAPGAAVVDLDRVQRRHRAGPRLRRVLRVAADGLGRARRATFGFLSANARDGLARSASLAAWRRPAPAARVSAFLLLLPPVLVAVVPVAVILVIFGGFSVFFLGAATTIVPPALLATLAAIVLLLALAASFVATLRLWLALLVDAEPASLRARWLAALGVVACALGASLTRHEPDNFPLTPHLVIAGVHVAPLALGAFDGAALLLVHALPRWSPGAERRLRVLALLALAGLAAAWAAHGAAAPPGQKSARQKPRILLAVECTAPPSPLREGAPAWSTAPSSLPPGGRLQSA